MQLSLLDQFKPAPDRCFANLKRHDLGDGAWVDYQSGWLRGQHEFFRLLSVTADWEKHRRVMYDRVVEVPRLVAGVPGSDPGFKFDDGEVERSRHTAASHLVKDARGALSDMAALLSVRYGRVLESVTLGYYRDGRDSVSFHGDKMGPLRKGTVVAIVSVGESRKFLLRPTAAARSSRRGSDTRTFRFGAGDLLVMGGTCQETWEHAVPKVQRCGPRIAVMFREKIPMPKRIHWRQVAGLESDAWRNVRNVPAQAEARFAATGRSF